MLVIWKINEPTKWLATLFYTGDKTQIYTFFNKNIKEEIKYKTNEISKKIIEAILYKSIQMNLKTYMKEITF